jgi:hypothetical protein
MPERAPELLQRAEMCRENSETATCARDKAEWVTFAEEWHRLAEEADPS